MNVVTAPCHIPQETPEGSKTILVSVDFKFATSSTLEDRWEALRNHVHQEVGSNVAIFKRQFFGYTHADGYIYKVWYWPERLTKPAAEGENASAQA